MYFSSDVAGGEYHVWRQAFPSGQPEQITFGPTEQEGTAITPDGRYLITSMGLQRASLILHDKDTSKPLTDEGFAMQPVLTAAGDRLFYVLRSAASRGRATGELWSLDVANGGKQQLFPGLIVSSYSVHRDGEHVLFTSVGHEGGDGLFLGNTALRESPRRLVAGNDIRGFFGGDAVVYRDTDGRIKRMRLDGSDAQTVAPQETSSLIAVSPDGAWASVTVPTDASTLGWQFLSLTGGPPFQACERCASGPTFYLNNAFGLWNSTGTELFVWYFGSVADRRTIVLPYKSGVPLEKQWPTRLATAQDALAAPGAHVLDAVSSLLPGSTYPGAGRDQYIHRQVGIQSNLYRVRLPQ